MKKILFLHDNLGVGGAEQLRLTLLKKIDRSQYDVRVCCISSKGAIGEEISKLGIPVDELQLNPSPKNIFTTLKIIKFLRPLKIDILHTCLFNAGFHGRIAGYFCHIPRIVSEAHGQHYEFNSIKYLPHVLAEFFLAKVSDAVICCSDASREDILKRERLPSDKVATITNCIDSSIYQVKDSREAVRKRLGINGEIVLITVASFWGMKGHIYLVKALSELKQLGYDFKWLCAGDGPLMDKIQDLCRDLKLGQEAVFLGRINNVADYLNAADIFILPSVSEALSIALLEALYMGLPCIVTDVGANREIVNENENGFIVKPRDKDGLLKAILRYFNDGSLIREFGRNNKLKAESKFLLTSDYLRKFYNIWDRQGSVC